MERMEVVAQVAEAWVGEGRAEVAQAGGGWAAVAWAVEAWAVEAWAGVVWVGVAWAAAAAAEMGWRTSPGWRWAGRDR